MPLLIFYTTAFPKSDTDINSMSPYQPRKKFHCNAHYHVLTFNYDQKLIVSHNAIYEEHLKALQLK